ncbi:MAG: hypothetical protein ACXVRZ_11695 [Gaiellaceae bacterium]
MPAVRTGTGAKGLPPAAIALHMTAMVVHHQPMTIRRYVSQHARYGRGSYHYHRGPNGRRSLERPQFYAGVLRRGFGAGFSVGLLVKAAQGVTALSYVGEWMRAGRPFRPQRPA